MKSSLIPFLFFISFNLISRYSYSQCSCLNNLDFENGNFANWNGYVGYNTNSAGNLTITGTGIINGALDQPVTACQFHTLIDGTYANDPYGNIVGVSPWCGSYSARLGGNQINLYQGYCNYSPYQSWSYSSGEVLEQTFPVTLNNAVFMYMFAIVLNGGTEPVGSGSYFRAEVLDQFGNQTDTCYDFYRVISTSMPPGFTTSSVDVTVALLPWKAKIVDLTPFVGQSVTLRFTAAGCAFGGHWGYAYVDVTCNPQITLTNNFCSDTVTLTAPDVIDATYTWTGPGIVGSNTTPTILVNAAGTYYVTINTGGSCNVTLSTNVTLAPAINFSATSVSPTCVSCNNGIINFTASGGTPGYTYSISPSVGNLSGNSFINLPPDTYYVCVTDTNGCMVCDSIIVPPYSLGVSHLSSSAFVFFNSNPFTGELILNTNFSPAANTYLYLYDALGRQVSETEIISKNTVISERQSLAAGIYFYNLKRGTDIIARGKAIIE